MTCLCKLNLLRLLCCCCFTQPFMPSIWSKVLELCTSDLVWLASRLWRWRVCGRPTPHISPLSQNYACSGWSQLWSSRDYSCTLLVKFIRITLGKCVFSQALNQPKPKHQNQNKRQRNRQQQNPGQIKELRVSIANQARQQPQNRVRRGLYSH